MAGFGGQGVMAMGQLTTYAGMIEGHYVSWMPSYGPEMRGGSANCSVVVSDEPVGAPVISVATDVIAMNQPSYEKFVTMLKKGGNLFVNSSLVHVDNPRDDINIYEIPVNEIAMELGNPKVANMVMLGAFIKVTEIVGEESVLKAFTKVYGDSKKKLIPLNQKALEEGQKQVGQEGSQDKKLEGHKRTPDANLVSPEGEASYLKDRAEKVSLESKIFSDDLSIAKAAILNATESINFYRMSSKQFEGQDAGRIFASLAKQKEEHVDYLNRLRIRLESGEEQKASYQADKEDMNWGKLDPAMASMALSVFSVAMNLVEKNVDFYEKAIEKSKDEKAKALYKELIYWERFHYDQLKGQYETYKEIWWSDQSFSPF